MNRRLSGAVFWPLTEWARGRNTMRRFRALQRSQHLSTDELRAVQEHKLRRLLQATAESCTFHARRFEGNNLDPFDPKLSIDDLSRLPTLSRADIRENLAELSPHGRLPWGTIPYTTGGSTGEPLKFFVDRHRLAADWAARWRARSWWGVQPGDPEILLWGAPRELQTNDRLRRWRDAMLNQRILSAFDMTDAKLEGYVRHIRTRRPACLYGYASSLALLARHALQRGMRPASLGSDRLRGVFVTGEVLLPPDREAIERAFGVPAVVEYGARDGGLIACACREGSLHIHEENVIVELLDERGGPVAPGEIGEVTVTCLEAFVLPMIRYRIGDLARATPTGMQGGAAGPNGCCPCGLALKTLAEVRGRITDHLVCRTGDEIRRMHALSLIYVLRETDGIRQFRINQTAIDSVDVEIVPNPAFTPATELELHRQLMDRMGSQVSICIKRCDRIAAHPSGKHICVTSSVG